VKKGARPHTCVNEGHAGFCRCGARVAFRNCLRSETAERARALLSPCSPLHAHLHSLQDMSFIKGNSLCRTASGGLPPPKKQRTESAPLFDVSNNATNAPSSLLTMALKSSKSKKKSSFVGKGSVSKLPGAVNRASSMNAVLFDTSSKLGASNSKFSKGGESSSGVNTVTPGGAMGKKKAETAGAAGGSLWSQVAGRGGSFKKR